MELVIRRGCDSTYSWVYSGVMLTIVTGAMLEVYYAATVERIKLSCLKTVVCGIIHQLVCMVCDFFYRFPFL